MDSPPANLCDPTKDFTLDDVIADVVRRFYLPLFDDLIVPDDVEPDFNDVEPGFDGEDVAVWRDGRLLAVIRAGADGKPVVTRFDA